MGRQESNGRHPTNHYIFHSAPNEVVFILEHCGEIKQTNKRWIDPARVLLEVVAQLPGIFRGEGGPLVREGADQKLRVSSKWSQAW